MRNYMFYVLAGFFLFSLPVCAQNIARGIVFEDLNKNGVKELKEPGIGGVSVTNGLDVVQTDEKGYYELPIENNQIIAVIKPGDFDLPVGDDQLPQFYYIHKPDGSPQLKYPGVKPTGPLPEQINFPLTKGVSDTAFSILLFGDPQAYTEEEMEYYEKGIINELVNVQGHVFGMSLGDLVGDRPDLFKPYINATKKVGIPWYNVLGNHDINFDATTQELSDESFEAHFGPSTYAFNHGRVHFIVLNNVIYPDPRDGKGSWTGLTGRQLAFLKNTLRYVPKDHLVVLAAHIPIYSMRATDRAHLFKLLKDFPHTLSLSAHTHRQSHYFMTEEQGWLRDEPHHHFNSGTTSGSWYSGRLDDDGVPLSMMYDGTPKGYSIVTFDGNQYKIDYKVAGKPADHRIGIYAPKVTVSGIKGIINIYANFYMGSANDTLMVRIGDGDWQLMNRVNEPDPILITERVAWDTAEEVWEGRRPGLALNSNHLWRLDVANRQLKQGNYDVEVKATDMFGQTFIEKVKLKVK